jgi:hypothetical protein
MDQGPPLTLESGPAATGGGRLADSSAPPITYAWCALGWLWGQGDVGPKKRGAVTLVRAPDLETDVDAWHVGLGGHIRPRTSPF